MKRLFVVAALVAAGIAPVASVQAQGRLGDIRITRAIYGAKEGSADVTPVVTSLIQPGIDEMYATLR